MSQFRIGDVVQVRKNAGARFPAVGRLAGKKGEVRDVVSYLPHGPVTSVLVKFPGQQSLVKLLVDVVVLASDVPTLREASRAASESVRVVGALGQSAAPPAKEEHAIQVALFEQIRRAAWSDPWWYGIYAVPNGTRTFRSVAAAMVAEGVEVGVPDIDVKRAMGGWFGLAIEMKSPTGTIEPLQKLWLTDLYDAGYLVDVCRSSDEAWVRLCWYRKLPPTVPVGVPALPPPYAKPV